MNDIVVYRSPLEKLMWDTYMNDPHAWLYLAGTLMALVAVIILYQWITSAIYKYRNKNNTWRRY